jgi:hypothetical protein
MHWILQLILLLFLIELAVVALAAVNGKDKPLTDQELADWRENMQRRRAGR